MHREDDSKFLLYIEPKKENKSEVETNDLYVAALEHAMSFAKEGTASYSKTDIEPRFDEGGRWKGWHTSDCGQWSSNCDYLLENGMITNSLGVYYLKNYRSSIPQSELKKLAELKRFYENKGVTFRENATRQTTD